MAPSPRSMWSGAISLGLLNVPVTIGKATTDTREESFKTLCSDHKLPIDRTERCATGDKNCSLAKVKAIAKPDGGFHVLSDAEQEAIEQASKSSTMTVLDVQPIFSLPMEWSNGNYYVRANAKVPGSEGVLALLVASLQDTDNALIVKWGNASRERLCVVHATSDGVLMLTTIPFLSDCRNVGDDELRHKNSAVDDKQKEMLSTLLAQTQNPDGFSWAAYEDAGLKARQEAAQAVLKNEKPKQKPQDVPEEIPNIMDVLNASIEQAKVNA